MRYFEWFMDSIHTPKGDLWVLDIPVVQVNGFWMREGTPVTDWNDRFIATYPPPEFVHVDFQPANWPILSPRFQEFFAKQYPCAFQFLPLRLQMPDGTGEVQGFAVGQALRRIDCLNRERTRVRKDDWTPRPNGVFNVQGTPCLSKAAIGDAAVFRIFGTPIKLIVREDVKDAIEAAGFTGCRFREIPTSQ